MATMKYVRSNLDEESEAGGSSSTAETFQNVPVVSVPRPRTSRLQRVRSFVVQRNYLEKFLFIAVCVLALVVVGLATFLYNVHCPARTVYKIQYRKEIYNYTQEKQNLTNVCLDPVCISLSSRILSYMNEAANPCEDFYEFACGSFKKRVAIPPGMQQVTSFSLQSDTNEILLRSILESPVDASDSKPGGFSLSYLHRSAATLYQACMNESAREAVGLGPVLRLLRPLGPWAAAGGIGGGNFNATDWNLTESVNSVTLFLLGYSDSMPFYGIDVQPDNYNSSRYVLYVGQPRTILVRENYLNNASENLAALEVALGSVSRLFNFSLTGADVGALVDLEKELAAILLPESERRDSTKILNATVKYLTEQVDCINWVDMLKRFIRNVSYPVTLDTPVNVRDDKFLERLCPFLKTLASDPNKKRTVNNYLLVRSTWPFLADLNKAAAQILRKLAETTEGVHGSLNPWSRCVRSVSSIFGFPLGKLYVDRHFDDRSKLAVDAMIDGVKAAFNCSLDEAAWMDAATRRQAKAKLAGITNLVGYPDYFTNETAMREEWASFNFSSGLYFANVAQVQGVSYAKAVSRLVEPVRLEFGMTPQSINAYYSPSSNVIAFPAGILQRPFYQPQFPAYISYGAIGAVIGHEVTHGFDDDGRNFDQEGNQRQWWSAATAAGFQAAASCIARQYEQFVVDGDVHVKGQLVLGESIADNGGLKNAYRAYKSQEGSTEELLLPNLSTRYTKDQLLFIAYSQTWCELETGQSMRQSVTVDPHPPGKMRVWGPISNSRDFGRVFSCKAGAKMNPLEKCTVW